MPISPANQVKHTATPKGVRKAGVYFWGDTDATWGDLIATWGGVTISPTNQTKSSQGVTYLITDEGDFLITDEGDFLITRSGGSVVNQSKS